MYELNVAVCNKIATYLRRGGYVVCGNTDYMVVFSFDEEWDAHEEKTARFIWNNKYVDVPFTGNAVSAPMVSDTTLLKVGVYAGELTTTTPAFIECKKSILCGSAIENPGAEDQPQIPEGYVYPSGVKVINQNGSYDVSIYKDAVVKVAEGQTPPVVLQAKTATKNGEVVTFDPGYDGLEKVTVKVPEPKLQEEKVVEIEGSDATHTFTPDEGYDGLKRVKIDVTAPTPKLQTKTAIENGPVEPDPGYDGLGLVVVNVPPSAPSDPVLQNKTVYENGPVTYDKELGYDGLGTVMVSVPDPVTTHLDATENRDYYPPEGVDGFSSVSVQVPTGGGSANLQNEKSVTIDYAGTTTVSPDAGYDGLKKVKVTTKMPQPVLRELIATENGVYNAADEGAAGYSTVEVNVEGGSSDATTVALDFTDYERGSFTETLSNGVVIKHTVEFDSDVPSFVDNIDVRGV